MKVKLTVPRACAKTSYRAGDEIEVTDAEAKRMIAAGLATAVDAKVSKASGKTTVETAAAAPQAETR